MLSRCSASDSFHGGGQRLNGRVVAGDFAVVGIANDARRIDDECPRQHLGVACVFSLHLTGGKGFDAGGQQFARVRQVVPRRAMLQSPQIIRFVAGGGETGITGREFAAVTLGMFWLAEANIDNLFEPRRVQFSLMLLQLSKPVATVYSAKVTEEGQQRWAVGPPGREQSQLPVYISYADFRGLIARIEPSDGLGHGCSLCESCFVLSACIWQRGSSHEIRLMIIDTLSKKSIR